ncbi:MAG: ATP-binding protein [Pseudomonadales bacterium]|nr:ATP-binding protein [Pseudomonadales bacterium]
MTPRLIVLTGAESSGKTTLANRLAGVLRAPLVTEVARELLSPGQPYGIEDVVAIGLEQHRREQDALASHTGWVIADTDLSVIRIWLEVRFGTWPLPLAQAWKARPPRLHVLTRPDMPWEADPLRENPHDRAMLHARYRALLRSLEEPWIEVAGDTDTRLQAVLDTLPPA